MLYSKNENDRDYYSNSYPLGSGDEDSFYNHSETHKLNKWEEFKHSFQRIEVDEPDPSLPELERAIIATANVPLNRVLKGRHLQMIALGSCIGTGFFIGSGSSLQSGGPAGLLIAFILIGSMIFCTIHALGELAVAFPISGGASAFSTRFIDPSWGFAMGWNYAIGWCTLLPLELVASSIIINYWHPNFNSVILVAVFLVLIVILNLFGVRGYGETELFLSLLKVIAVVGFIILGIVIACGGGPEGEYIGTKYWRDPGAFANGFKGVSTVFVVAAFAFAGTEIVGLASAEAENPARTLPKATKQIFWRITIFYVLGLFIVGLIVPYNDSKLDDGQSDYDSSVSPFIIATKNAGIKGLPTVMNVAILISVLSVANSAVFAASRTLASLGLQSQAPKIFGYIDNRGRPLVATAFTLSFGLLSFVAASDKATDVFHWLLSLTGLSFIFTWMSICICHLRFRYALAVRGRGTDELVFTSQVGIWGSIYSVLLNILVLILQFWVGLFPIGSKTANAANFFQAYLAAPIILISYFCHKIYKKQWILYIRADRIDIDLGRREFDLDELRQEIADNKEYIASRPFYYRAYRYWC